MTYPRPQVKILKNNPHRDIVKFDNITKENDESQDTAADIIYLDQETESSAEKDHQNTPPKKLNITKLVQQLTTQKDGTEAHKTNNRTKLNNIKSKNTKPKVK